MQRCEPLLQTTSQIHAQAPEHGPKAAQMEMLFDIDVTLCVFVLRTIVGSGNVGVVLWE
jgi:hypothetical protein